MKTRVHLGDHRMEVEPYNGFPVTGSWDGMGSNLTSMMTGMGNYFILAILLFRLIFSVELYGIAACFATVFDVVLDSVSSVLDWF
jgi:hypothetical protein